MEKVRIELHYPNNGDASTWTMTDKGGREGEAWEKGKVNYIFCFAPKRQTPSCYFCNHFCSSKVDSWSHEWPGSLPLLTNLSGMDGTRLHPESASLQKLESNPPLQMSLHLHIILGKGGRPGIYGHGWDTYGIFAAQRTHPPSLHLV